MQTIKQWKCHGGRQLVLRHDAQATAVPMEFSLYLPPAAEHGSVPCVLYLSGLTCTWENATTKAGFQRVAAELGLAIVCPDTSPRGEHVPDDPSPGLGQGAGFYVDATQAPWRTHFQMERYVASELPTLLADAFPIAGERFGIAGHSMGGHGALTLGLRHPERFVSISAFSPIVTPSRAPWGETAFTAYLGSDRTAWAEHDACALLSRRTHPHEILVDQGDADEFLGRELRTAELEAAARTSGQALRVRMQPGYDHSYYFISTFIADHLRHHAEVLTR